MRGMPRVPGRPGATHPSGSDGEDDDAPRRRREIGGSQRQGTAALASKREIHGSLAKRELPRMATPFSFRNGGRGERCKLFSAHCFDEGMGFRLCELFAETCKSRSRC